MKKTKRDYPVLDPVIVGDENENIKKDWINDVQIPEPISKVIKKRNKAVVLVLSGGGLKAFAQVGAYKELHRIACEASVCSKNFTFVDAIVASSGGAFTGSAICNGLSLSELENSAAVSIGWGTLVELDIGNRKGLVSMKPLENLVRKWGAKTFNDLHLPEAVIAYQMDQGAVLGWGDNPVAPWVRASCSMIYRVGPLKFIDKQDQRVFELVDGSDYSDKWKNPVEIARDIFPHALLINIDLSRKSAIRYSDEKVVHIRPFTGINPVEDFRYTFTKRWKQAMSRGADSVIEQEDDILRRISSSASSM
ncbi:MAG: patatin-like phospholipase family protein [Candidatus Dojkabacteria bacterium]|nr:patatin-like phospholipase family protein [Candidatus Dojkabacteria bacterium]